MSGKEAKHIHEHGRYLRLPAWAKVTYTFPGNHDPELSRVQIRIKKHRPIPCDRISEERKEPWGNANGLFFDAQEEIAPGTLLEISVAMQPGSEKMTIRGEVERVLPVQQPKGYQVTIIFMSSNAEETRRLSEFISRYYN